MAGLCVCCNCCTVGVRLRWPQSMCARTGAGGGDGLAKVWDVGVSPPRVVVSLGEINNQATDRGHTRSVSCVLVLRNGRIATGGFDDVTIVWSLTLPSGQPLSDGETKGRDCLYVVRSVFLPRRGPLLQATFRPQLVSRRG